MEKIYFVFGYFHLSLYGGINKNPEKITKYASKECDHKDITERPQIFFIWDISLRMFIQFNY